MPEPWMNPEWKPPASVPTSIVFVHGAIVNGWEMALLRRRLRQLGYHVRQFKYQSMLKGLDDNVGRLRDFIRETPGEVIHVVGHSMGGVLLRHAFEQSPDPRPGRLLVIGAPLLDCWVGHRFLRLHTHLGRYMIGRTVLDHISRTNDPVWRGARDFGVLAGTYPFGVGAIFKSLPFPSDGVVILAETRLQGLRDHLTIRLNHFGMLFSKRCCMQVARFLAAGTFTQVTSSEKLEAMVDSRPATSPVLR